MLGPQVNAQTWISLGPSPNIFSIDIPTDQTGFNSGRVSSIDIDPTDLNHWLIGVGGSGVWESRNAGDSWTPLTDDAPTLAIGSVAFAPSNPKIIYAATGEVVGHAGLGMLKSTDGGKTWALLGASSLARAAVRRIKVHPTNPDIVLVTLSWGNFGRDTQPELPGQPPFGILRSTDGGATWVRTLPGLATALEVDPTNFNNQYAAIVDRFSGVVSGLYRSNDGGQTWSLINGPWGISTTTTAAFARTELAIAPSNRDVLYASFQMPAPNQSLLGLYRTDNAWAATPAWVRVPTDSIGNGGYCGPNKCDYSHVISVHPTDPNMLFAGGGENQHGFWICSNCGTTPTWTSPAAHSNLHPDHHAFAWAGNRLIDGNDGGLWSTADLGATFQNHNRTLPTFLFHGGALHPTNPNFILGGIRDFSISLRRATNTWHILPFVFPPSNPSREWGEAEVAISSSHPDTDWMAAWCCRGLISRTTDGGKTGVPADAGIDITGVANVAPVRKCPYNDDVFLTGTNRLWRTNNFFNSAAPSWVENSPLLTPPAVYPDLSGRSPLAILSIAYNPSDRTCNTYAYGNRTGQVRFTSDGGQTWRDLDPGRNLPTRSVNSLAIDPQNPQIMYAAVSSFDDATPGKPGHVFKSTNALSASPSWVNVSPPLNQPFNVLAIDPRNPLLVYAGSENGLWVSNDGAATWRRMGLENGLPPGVTVLDIQINPATDRTVISTWGRGVYALDTGAPTISEITNAASFVPWITPGSLATVFGNHLSPVEGVEFPGAATSHRGVTVTVQGIPAPLLAVANVNGKEQINFQVPFGISVPSTRVEVNNNGNVVVVDPIQVLSVQPGFFEYVPSGTNLSYAAVIRPDASTVSPANPAARGETVLLYLTGLGPTSPAMQTGQLGPSNPPAVTSQTPRVTIGGVPATISFSGYAPGFLGLYQINAVIPPTAPVGSSVELNVTIPNVPGQGPSPVSSKTSHIAVR